MCCSRSPRGRLGSRAARAVVAGFYVVLVVVWVPLRSLTPDAARLVTWQHTRPENPLAIGDSDRAGDAIYAVRDALIIVVGALCVMLAPLAPRVAAAAKGAGADPVHRAGDCARGRADRRARRCRC
jgi:hypothetical protein